MGALGTAMKETVSTLMAAGIRATDDPRNVNPPCILVVPPSLALDSNCGGQGTFSAFVIGRAPANADTWNVLDDMAQAAGQVITVESIAPTSYQVEDTAPLPALQLTWTRSVDWPA